MNRTQRKIVLVSSLAIAFLLLPVAAMAWDAKAGGVLILSVLGSVAAFGLGLFVWAGRED